MLALEPRVTLLVLLGYVVAQLLGSIVAAAL